MAITATNQTRDAIQPQITNNNPQMLIIPIRLPNKHHRTNLLKINKHPHNKHKLHLNSITPSNSASNPLQQINQHSDRFPAP